MSNKNRASQYSDPKGTIVEAFDPNVGIINEGDTLPTDATAGYAPGALFFKRAGTAGASLYVNEGTKLSCAFKPFTSQVNAILGVGAGYKVARGQLTTATALDTVITGLATVVSVVATLESDPVDTCSIASAAIGNQSGAPAAGSVFIKTWKPTTGGAAGNPTLIAATTPFSKLVNWIAIGT